mmetsp:Transcript_53956/g.94638  ORF Transcript_53956/g.94638 Transcript_53956/m.94638 type:complete len:166 (-) Transcript_53956:125-622(-)
MARVGVCNYANSSDHPVRVDSYWRRVLEREQRDHAYSSLNERFPKSSYAYLNTTSNDFQSRTWQLLDHTHTVAAGKSSFHNNVSKPMGTAGGLHAASSSASFERLPRSRAGSSRSMSGTGAAMLQGSASAGMLPYMDATGRPRTGASERSMRSTSTTGSRRRREQ